MTTRQTAAVLAAAAAAVSAPVAAASPQTHQYGNPAGHEQAPAASGPLHTSVTHQGALPFTGLDLTIAIAAGGLLATSGAVVRRLTRKSDS